MRLSNFRCHACLQFYTPPRRPAQCYKTSEHARTPPSSLRAADPAEATTTTTAKQRQWDCQLKWNTGNYVYYYTYCRFVPVLSSLAVCLCPINPGLKAD